MHVYIYIAYIYIIYICMYIYIIPLWHRTHSACSSRLRFLRREAAFCGWNHRPAARPWLNQTSLIRACDGLLSTSQWVGFYCHKNSKHFGVERRGWWLAVIGPRTVSGDVPQTIPETHTQNDAWTKANNRDELCYPRYSGEYFSGFEPWNQNMFDFFGHGELIVFCFVVDVLISLTWKPRGPSQLVTQLEANLCPQRGRPRCMWREVRQKIGRTKRCSCGLNLSKIFWGNLSQFQIPHWRLLWKILISSDHEMWNNVKCDITIDTFCCFHCRCDSRKDCLWYSYWKTGLGWRDDWRKLKKVGGKPQRWPESLPSNALGITSINEYSASGRIPTSIIFQELKCGFVQKHPNQESNVFVVSHMFITTIGILGVYLIPCCWLQNDRYSTRSIPMMIQWWCSCCCSCSCSLPLTQVRTLCVRSPFDVSRGRRISYGILNYIPSILLSISSQKGWVTYCYHLLS